MHPFTTLFRRLKFPSFKRNRSLPIGSRHYRAFVGPPEKYDVVAATQFNLLTTLGLREHHTLLDIGCGSLRAGRLFIPFLLPGNYFGLEPNKWLVDDGIEKEVGRDLIKIKRPGFDHNSEFRLRAFGRQFDYLLAHSIFSHAAPGQIEKCLSEAAAVMHPESVLVATYIHGERNHEGEEWMYPDCVEYTEERMLQFARGAGLVSNPYSWPHPNNQRWLLTKLAA